MKRIYTHHNPMLVGIVKGRLELEGFRVELRNDLVSGAAGELAPIDLWPELWLEERQDEARAQALVAKITEQQGKSSGELWHCERCGEANEGNFEVCWNCQHAPH